MICQSFVHCAPFLKAELCYLRPSLLSALYRDFMSHSKMASKCRFRPTTPVPFSTLRRRLFVNIPYLVRPRLPLKVLLGKPSNIVIDASYEFLDNLPVGFVVCLLDSSLRSRARSKRFVEDGFLEGRWRYYRFRACVCN